MKKIIAIGDNCVDSYINLNTEYAGGNAVNFAVYMKQYGENSYYLGNIGNDKEGQIIKDALIKENIGCDYLKIINGHTAVTTIELINNERKFLKYDSGVLKELSLTSSDINEIKHFDILHFSINGYADQYISQLKTQTNCLVYDFSDEWEMVVDRNFYKYIDYGFISNDELSSAEIQKTLKHLYNLGIKTVICTRGKKGSILYNGKIFIFKNALAVDVVDTLGAGDSFIAGFIYAKKVLELDDEKAMDEGITLSTKRIQKYGAF